MANDQLIDEVISAVLYHKKQHDQSTWAYAETNTARPPNPDFSDPDCGATACIAGWACILTGQQMKWTRMSGGIDEDGHRIVYYWRADVVGNHEVIQDVATEALGLTYSEAHAIFHTIDNETAIQMLKQVKNGEKIVDEDGELIDEDEDRDEDPEPYGYRTVSEYRTESQRRWF